MLWHDLDWIPHLFALIELNRLDPVLFGKEQNMVKKYFRNSIAGACMAMSLALGASSVGSIAVLADEPDTEQETAEETELQQTEAETQAATEAPAAEAPATEAPAAEEQIQALNETEPAVDMTDVAVSQDVTNPAAGDTVKETFNFSYNKAEDTEFKLDIDSALDLTEVEVSSSSPLYNGKMTVSHANGSSDIDINQEKIDLTMYEGITKLVVRPADSDADSNTASFSASFIVKEAKDEIKNTATVTSTLGEKSQPMVFAATEPETEAETIPDASSDTQNAGVEEAGGNNDAQSDGNSVDTYSDEETEETQPASEPQETESESESESESETQEQTETQPASSAYINAEYSAEHPVIDESFKQTVKVAYDAPEDTMITYEVPSAVKINSIEVDEYCGLFGGTLTVVYQDGEKELAIDSETINLSSYAGITKLIIVPNTSSQTAATGKFVVNMQVSSEVEEITCTTTIDTTYDSIFSSDSLSPAYASVSTPKVQVSPKTVAYGDKGTVYFSDIAADFNGTSSDLEFVMTDLPSELEITEFVLPEFTGVSSIDVYATNGGMEKPVKSGAQPGASISLSGTGYTGIRLVIHPSGMSVRSSSEGRLVLKATEDMEEELSVSFKGKTSAAYGSNVYSKTSDSDTCSFAVHKSYTITFDSQGGTSISPITAKSGTKVDLAVPTRTGYTFDYWYSSDGTHYSGSMTVTGDVVLYAHWTEIETEDTSSSGGSGDSGAGDNTGSTLTGGSGDSGSSSGTGTEDTTSSTEDTDADENTDNTDDTKQQILERALEDADEAADDEARSNALNDRINAIINSATSDEDEDDDDSSSSSSHTSASDPETYADWTVKPIFEDIINNLVKMYIQPIDESLIANPVPDEALLQQNLTAEAESEENSEEESEEESEDEGLDIVTLDDLTPDESEL